MTRQYHNHENTSKVGSAVYCCNCQNPQTDAPLWEETVEPHTHVTKSGALVQCYHQCRSAITSVGFWAGMTLGFPIEHFLWTKIYPFTLVAKLLGL